mmetsp:Transcript_55284/g.115658  ORF Transcript_55284/g.115658 Transcript_55284/m.115658 type:complete len:223 (+) Transcript_55284:751-1419(+)
MSCDARDESVRKESPKSASRSSPSSASSRLAFLTSRCTQPRQWMYSSADASCRTHASTRAGGGTRRTWSASEPPPASSITSSRWRCVRSRPRYRTTCGCWSLPSMSASLSTASSVRPAWTIFRRRKRLTAQRRPPGAVMRYVIAKAPLPSSDRSSGVSSALPPCFSTHSDGSAGAQASPVASSRTSVCMRPWSRACSLSIGSGEYCRSCGLQSTKNLTIRFL